MKKWEKEILQKQIGDEQQAINRLESTYKHAIEGVKEKIQVLMSREQTQSVIYQLQYQQALQKQLEDIFSKMASEQYSTIHDYLKDCYEDSFYSTMYSLHQQGIPLVIPFNQEEVAQMAAQSDYDGIKLSDKLYNDSIEAARVARQEISKGIAMNSSFADIARQITKRGEPTLNQAYRIVRTEGHRITEETTFKTVNKAKAQGADVVKQWDSAIDKRTRPSHVALDGQLREIEQPFKSPLNGHTAMYPGGFGIASEDIHCRCTTLQRARWALDKSEIDKAVGDLDGMSDSQLDELSKKLGVSKEELIKKSNGVIESDGSINHTIKAQNYNQFKKKYQKKEKIEQAKQAAKEAVEAEKIQPKIDLSFKEQKAKKFSSNREATEYHKKTNFSQEKWDNEFSEKERTGVTDYTGHHYGKMNGDLRKDEYESSSYKDKIDGCTSALEKCEVAEDVVVWRGMGSNRTLGRALGVDVNDIPAMIQDDSIVGQRFIEKGFSSTGVVESAGWDKDVFLEIFVPKGTKGMYVDPISQHAGEQELLLQRGTSYEILKAEEINGKYKLTVSVVDHSY